MAAKQSDQQKMAKWLTQNPAFRSDPEGFLGQFRDAVAAAGGDIANIATTGGIGTALGFHPATNFIESIGGSTPGPAKTAAPKATAKKAAKKDTNPTTKDLTAAQQQQLATDQAFTQMAQTLIDQNKSITDETSQLIAGQGPATQAAEDAAKGIAQSALSATPGASNWLSQNIAQANAQSAPLQEAMKAYATAYTGSEDIINKSLLGMGQANTKYLEAAPLQNFVDLLQARASSPYYPIPSNVANNLPQGLQYALQQAGVQGITTPKKGWPKALTGGTTQASNPLLGSALTGTPANTPALQSGSGGSAG